MFQLSIMRWERGLQVWLMSLGMSSGITETSQGAPPCNPDFLLKLAEFNASQSIKDLGVVRGNLEKHDFKPRNHQGKDQ